MFFLSYRTQFTQFTELQSIFLNKLWANTWNCNTSQTKRSCKVISLPGEKQFGEYQRNSFEQSWGYRLKLFQFSINVRSACFSYWNKIFLNFWRTLTKCFWAVLRKIIKLYLFSGKRTSEAFFSPREKLFGEHQTNFPATTETKLDSC